MRDNVVTRNQQTRQASGLPVSGILQRKCTCGQHTTGGGECADCRNKRMNLQRKATGYTELKTAPPIVHKVLRSPGRSLDATTRGFMEARFSHNFSDVRVHIGPWAAASAHAIDARAYTVGRDIVFGAGKYTPQTHAGQSLLAHELTHVVQQQRAAASGNLTLQHAADPLERQATKMGERVLADPHRQPITPLPTQQVQLQGEGPAAEGGGLSGLGGSLVEQAIENAARQGARIMATVLPIPVPEAIIAALIAAESSFLFQSYRRLVSEGGAMRILRRVTELLDPRTALEFYGRYLWGVLQGLVSPITGLVHLAILGVRFQTAATQWMLSQTARLPELVTEAQALGREFEQFQESAERTLASLRQRDRLLEFAGAIFAAAATASEAFESQMIQMARQKGREAANNLVDHFLTTPLPSLAETVGEIVGTVIIELVLLLFTDGIGNLITKIGEFARALRPLSRGVALFAEVASRIGRVITTIEHLIGQLLSRTVLRPLMPIFEALGPVLGRMRRFARRLVGLSDEVAAGTVRAGTSLAEGAAESSSRVTPHRVPPEPPVSGSTGGGRPRRPRLGGATAEGTGEEFVVETFPERQVPVPERGRGRIEEPPPTTTTETPAGSTATRERFADLPEELAETTERTATGARSPSAPSELNVPEEALAEEVLTGPRSRRLSPRTVWEPPPGARPRPPATAAPEERLAWLRERLQLHVDQAIERFRVEGLTPRQAARTGDIPAPVIARPGQYRAFRGSRIDQFAKESIMQDPDLAEVITAPDFVGEPDILDSMLPDWFDITTRQEWTRHLLRYQERYGTQAHILVAD